MRLVTAIALLMAACAHAQSIDQVRSKFLSSPNGRTGCYSPFRLVIKDVAGVDAFTVRSTSEGVSLDLQVAVSSRAVIEVILPVMVSESARLFVEGPQSAELKPELPLRRIEPDFARPYAAVFSTDPVYARGLVPSTPHGAICDYYALEDFFTDWRLLDGYDAIIILNPAEVRLPEGSQRAMAEFCSLGGCALIAGSFRFGEEAMGLPAPAEASVRQVRDVHMQRFGYGAGTIYRVSPDDLRASASAHDVILDALRDHTWYGGERAPAGKPLSRLAPLHPPLAGPLPPAGATPTPLFWGLAGGLLVLCGIAPAVAARATRKLWPAHFVVFAGAMALAGVATLQEQPLPAVETSTIILAGDGEAAAWRTFIHADRIWRDTMTLDLADTENRVLYRACASSPGWRAWIEDRPLTHSPAPKAEATTARGGTVGDKTFRDFSTEAHRGNTSFSADDAVLVGWWLEETAFRGRASRLSPLEPVGAPWPGAQTVVRGAIGVTPLRAGD